MRRVGVLLGALALTACTAPAGTDAGEEAVPSPTSASPVETEATTDPDTPTSWGPSVGELEKARALVAGWTPAQLAGGVIVGRFHGTDPAIPSDMVKELHLAGVSVTGANIADEAQVRAMTAALGAAAVEDGRSFPPVIGIDQEGGYVSHLRGVATEFPHFESAGRALQQDSGLGRRVTREAAVWTAMELRDLGFTWVFAPVADVTIGAADPTIGARSPSPDTSVAAAAIGAAVRGYNAAGIVSTTKHFPGHGTATSDSHDTLPVVEATLGELRAHDLPPFESAVAARAPSIMLSHLDLTHISPGVPASIAPEVYELLREDLGFEGVAITDSLGMGALGGQRKPAVAALAAGADLLLMPVDTQVTHRLVTDAIRSGELSRARAEEAAARVVAVQLWHQRVAEQRPAPDDVVTRAQSAADALLAAAY